MKLNYRERGILLGAGALVIAVAGIFAIIKPKYQTIQSDKESLESVKAEWDEIETKINAIPGLQTAIKESYNESKKLSDDFVDLSDIDSTYKLDQFMQPYVDECELEASVIDLSNTTTSTLQYYYFTPSVITSSMFDAADVNGNYQAEIDSEMAESNAIAARTAETVLCTKYGFAATGTKENIWKFMQEISDLNSSILIDSVSISDYTFGEGTEGSDNTSDVTFVMSIYSVFDMDEPVTE
jgi:hypothetical protein